MQSRAAKFTAWIAGIVIIPVILYWLFANQVIKSVLEAQLTQAHGAEVNIGKFEHSLFPLKVELNDVDFTDAAHPQKNQLTVGHLAGDVEFGALLSDQLIMNQLDVLDVAFNQPRQSPGKVLRQPQEQSFEELFSEAKEALPSVDELLARSPLKTTAAVEQAQATYETYAAQLKAEYQSLPDKERLTYYQTEIQKLRETDFKNPAAVINAKEAFDKLQQQVRVDKEKITAFTDNASEAKMAMSDALQALKVAPEQDYEFLKGVYAGDHAALSQLTKALFGEKAAQYNRYLFSAFDLVVPLLKGGHGEAQNEEQVSSPMEVLIRQANVSVNWQDTQLTGDWKNITNMHTVFDTPTTFLLNAITTGKKSFSTEGQFFIDENGLDAAQTWQVAGLLLDTVTLSNNARLDASIKQALLATTGSLTIKDNSLNGTGKIDLSELTMVANGSDSVTRAVATLLDRLKKLDMTMKFGGTLSAIDVAISSDLDRQIANAVLSTLSASQQDKLDKLNARLQEMIGNQDDVMASELGDISALLRASQDNEAALQELLLATFKNTVENQKQKLLNKLFNKLDGR